MLLVDAHQDLAWNMLTFGRDYTRSVYETRRLEAGTPVPAHNCDTLLGWPEYQAGRVAVIFSTLFAAPLRRREGEWDSLFYADERQAHLLYRNQIDAYRRLVDLHPEKFRLLASRYDLQAVMEHWQQRELDYQPPRPGKPEDELAASGPGHPVGLVLLMEGADGVRAPEELAAWQQWGVRIVGPAWAGTRYCGGTGEPGPLTREGFALLEVMAALGMVLDISHMDEQAARQALDVYPGTVIATHANVQSLLEGKDGNRHLKDPVIHSLIERGGVIGIVPYNGFLDAGWRKGDPRLRVPLARVVEHIDYVCQLAGDTRHVGLGTDFDGGFGLQWVPEGLDSVADLQKLAPLLSERGYSGADIAAVFGQNWLRMLRENLPS